MGGVKESSYTFFERAKLLVCRNQYLLYVALVLESMLWTLAILSLLFGRLDDGTRLVLYIDLLLLSIVTLPVVGGLIMCRRA